MKFIWLGSADAGRCGSWCVAAAGEGAVARLERYFDVDVVTQNVDDLHERAGSTRVHHLHGELRKVRALDDENLLYTLPSTRAARRLPARCAGTATGRWVRC